MSLHVDGQARGTPDSSVRSSSRKMKPRAVFINASRGMVVDDVVAAESTSSPGIWPAPRSTSSRSSPKAQGDAFDSPLRGLDNVILTPHVGGSTQEAQEEIGAFVDTKLLAFAATGSTARCR